MREIFEKIFSEKTKIKNRIELEPSIEADLLYPLITYIEELEVNVSEEPVAKIIAKQTDEFNKAMNDIFRPIDETPA